MWPMHIQSLKLLHPTNWEEMHLQENTLFDHWPWPRSQGQTSSPVCDLCTCTVWSCYLQRFGRRCIYKKIHYMTFDLGVKVMQNVAQYLVLHVTYAAAKFEVAMSNNSGDAFTRKMKKVNKQCLLDTPRTVRVREKTCQVIVQTSRLQFWKEDFSIICANKNYNTPSCICSMCLHCIGKVSNCSIKSCGRSWLAH